MIGILLAMALQAAQPAGPPGPPSEAQKAQMLRQMGYSQAAVPVVEGLIDQLEAGHGGVVRQLDAVRAQIDQENAASQPDLSRIETLMRQQQDLVTADQKHALDLIFAAVRTLSPADQKVALRMFLFPPRPPGDGAGEPSQP